MKTKPLKCTGYQLFTLLPYPYNKLAELEPVNASYGSCVLDFNLPCFYSLFEARDFIQNNVKENVDLSSLKNTEQIEKFHAMCEIIKTITGMGFLWPKCKVRDDKGVCIWTRLFSYFNYFQARSTKQNIRYFSTTELPLPAQEWMNLLVQSQSGSTEEVIIEF